MYMCYVDIHTFVNVFLTDQQRNGVLILDTGSSTLEG